MKSRKTGYERSSARRERKRERRQDRPSRPEGWDLARLEAISTPLGQVDVEGEPVLVIRPRGDYTAENWDHGCFDSEVCAAGLKAYIRPISPSDDMHPERSLGGEPPTPGSRPC